MREKIVARAGPKVQREYEEVVASGESQGTSGGELPCRNILFIPFQPESRDENKVKASVGNFINTAFFFAQAYACKTIGEWLHSVQSLLMIWLIRGSSSHSCCGLWKA